MIKRKKNLKKKRHKIQRKSTFIAFYLKIIPSPIVQKYRCNFIKRRPKISLFEVLLFLRFFDYL